MQTINNGVMKYNDVMKYVVITSFLSQPQAVSA